ncbi:MAG: inorganic diphosphatase [Candidatus Doudnabacteria bacterium]|nr:inorganic diphosphatase [Candidatus Doudnabacteria bacterium]
MNIKDLPFGEIEKFNVVIEIPQGSQDKYEYDEKLDVIKLDRVLFGSQRFPANYGFIPQTRAEDGDHTDVVLLATNPINSGFIVSARAIGFMEMIDGGEIDNKIIAVPTEDPRFKDIQALEDLPEHRLKEIQNFFETYKLLQNKKVEVKGFHGKEQAVQEIEKTKEVYSKE